MTTTEMKEMLYQKLKGENCYFTKSHISIRKTKSNEITVVIKDYEPYSFTIEWSIDDIDRKYTVCVSMYYKNEYITMIDYEYSNIDYDFKSALIELGYYIGTRF